MPDAMRTRRLGSTNVLVTEVGFGAAPIGNLFRAIDDDTAQATVAAAWRGGIRYFDTAPHYGLGLSERRLGAALAGHPRSDFTISTKVGRLLVANPSPAGSDLDAGGFDVPDDLARIRDYSRDGVVRSIESSLTRLGLDHIDVVYVHDPEDHMDEALAQAFPALAELRDQGVVGAIGAGMNFVEPLRRVVAEADVDAVMVAGRYTLLDRSASTLLDDCRARNVSVVAAAPFNSGLLARPWPSARARFDYQPVTAPVLERARAYARICIGHDAALPQVALQFPLRHPAVATVVVGMGSAAHVEATASWAVEPVPAKLWSAIDEDL
jgi:D-threo-aldose 1-dehydrogenase